VRGGDGGGGEAALTPRAPQRRRRTTPTAAAAASADETNHATIGKATESVIPETGGEASADGASLRGLGHRRHVVVLCHGVSREDAAGRDITLSCSTTSSSKTRQSITDPVVGPSARYVTHHIRR